MPAQMSSDSKFEWPAGGWTDCEVRDTLIIVGFAAAVAPAQWHC
jgi:hypothetical protein